MAKTSIDKDLKKIATLEGVIHQQARQFLPSTFAFLFLMLVGLAALGITGMAGWPVIIVASVIGGYMALNIGANDVANNMSPAVGSRALTIGVAVAIAAVCEAAGAILAGGDVVATVSSGIIDPDSLPSPDAFVIAMLAALLAAALWLNLATALGAPVSTTHSIVGGVLGGGVAMAGFAVVDWGVVARIVASWVISPLMGGIIAAAFLAYIKFTILYVPDKLEQARRRVPMLVGLMAGAFATYLVIKGFSRIWDAPVWLALVIGVLVLLVTRMLIKPQITGRIKGLDNSRGSVAELFTIPVIVGAALLSFAHGSNDVANAIGPLAAIYTTVSEGRMVTQAEIPLWVLLVGALGISAGLLLFGPKLIRTVGSKITKLNRIRAFCVTLSAAITVIIASSFGIPVSSTHIAIGALFGVGFLREFIVNRANLATLPLKPPEPEIDPETGAVIKPGQYRKAQRRYLVRRSHVITIVAAWIVTVPATALLAAGLAMALRGIGLNAIAPING